MTHVLQGVSGAPGIAFGTMVRLHPPASAAPTLPPEGDVMVYFKQVQARVITEFEGMATELRAAGKVDEAAILDAQALLAGDAALTEEVQRRIEDEHVPLGTAIHMATTAMAALVGNLDDPYLRERAADVLAVGKQLQQGLVADDSVQLLLANAVVVSQDLTLLETATLHKNGIAGIATASGTATSHVAILARGLGIPAVVGLGTGLMDLASGLPVILDADRGLLMVEPSPTDSAAYAALHSAQQASAHRRFQFVDRPARSRDGFLIDLWANIGHPAEAQVALRYGAGGIGLLRTEFLLLERTTPASEDEQYAAYAEVLRSMAGRPVIARTLDIGADKPLASLPRLDEANPFLGSRGMRHSMCFPELFQTQLRAFLRAAPHGDLRLMLPMVTTPADVAWARAQLAQVVDELAQSAVEYCANIPLGIMVETPAAALTLDRFTGIDFCSIGSNDLAQYTLAADRTDAVLAQRYRFDDPAVFRLLRIAAEAATRLHIPMSLCGELAADPQHAIALVGLGITTLSTAPTAIPGVKEAIQGVSLSDAKRRASQACDDDRG